MNVKSRRNLLHACPLTSIILKFELYKAVKQLFFWIIDGSGWFNNQKHILEDEVILLHMRRVAVLDAKEVAYLVVPVGHFGIPAGREYAWNLCFG